MTLIWPNSTKIEVLGVCGDYASGKTLFMLTIDPARTIYFDLEKSGATYQGLGYHRIDFPAELQKKYGQEICTAKQTFEYWYEMAMNINPGEYSVMAVDPISDIEAGMTDWVKSKYKRYGFSSEDKFVAMGGAFWGAVKDEWKRILLNLSSRVQTFAFSVHMRKVWKFGKQTEKTEPKGKSTLKELSTLYLHLNRNPDKEGSVPLVPSATVVKDRLSRIEVVKVEGEEAQVKIIPILPPRIKSATPDQIRQYIINPPSYENLKSFEKTPEKELSESEKLEIESQIAADRRAAEEAALESAKLRQSYSEAREEAVERMMKNLAAQTNGDEIGKATHPMTECWKERILDRAEKLGVFDRVKAAIIRTLSARGILESYDPSLLTPEEQQQFLRGLDVVELDARKTGN